MKVELAVDKRFVPVAITLETMGELKALDYILRDFSRRVYNWKSSESTLADCILEDLKQYVE